MKKTYLLIFTITLSLIKTSLFAQGNLCSQATPFCTAVGTPFTFPNVTGGSTAQMGPNYGCLSSQPNPSWFFIQSSAAGLMTFNISQYQNANGTGTALDVDFIAYGPFSTSASCSNLTNANNIEDCSYSGAAIETMLLNPTAPGQFFIIMITNFNGGAGYINFTQTGGPPSDCSITCPLNNFTLVGTVSSSGANIPNGSTVNCNAPFVIEPPSLPLNNVNSDILTPCIKVSYEPFRNNISNNGTVRVYEGGVQAWATSCPVLCGANTIGGTAAVNNNNFYTYYMQVDPAQQHDFSFCKGAGAIGPSTVTIRNCWDNTIIDGPTVWSGNGGSAASCFTLTAPANTSVGTGTFAIAPATGSVGIVDSNWGLLSVNPALIPGGQTYTVTYTFQGPANCPPVNGTYTFSVPAVPSLNAISSKTVCAGSLVSATNFTTSPVGGSYNWTNNNTAIGVVASGSSNINSYTAPSVTVTTVGVFTVTPVSSGCIGSSKIFSITIIPKPTLAVAPTSASICPGIPTSLTSSGASTYTWTGLGFTTTTGSVVTASPTITTIYTVTGTSAAGCVATKTMVVTVNPLPSVAISSSVNPSCGQNNGTLTIIPTSTVSVPISSITSTSGTVTGQTITGLGAGSPTITITSNLGCTFTLSPTLTMTPGPSSIALTPTNATCGNNNGSFTFGSPTGGTPLYSYAINGGAFSATSPTTGLTPGTYSVTVKDSKGCLLTQTTSIVAISTPTAITGNSSPASCAGATGSYTVTGVSGGVATYSYSIDNGALSTSTVITNLSQGTHSISVTDVNGCAFATTFSVGVVAGITSATVIPSTASCGVANATATVTTILGGAPSYSFSFDNGAFSGSSSVTGLAAGNHNVLIRDVNTCTLSVPFTVISLGSPTTSITSFSNVTCSGLSNGSCTVAIPTGGGGAPFTYTLTSPFQTNGIGVFNGLPAGTYNISVQDAAGCIATTSVIIGQPVALTVSTTATPVLCNGGATGSINLTGSGGTTTYSYNLNGGAYQASSSFSNQVAGIYTMGIKDVNGCLATQTVQITQPTALAIAVSSQSANCTAANGIASATVSGGAGSYTYNWTPTGGTASTSNPLVGGTYTITATDANTCSISSPVVIGVTTGGSVGITSFANVSCKAACNGSITVGMTGGTPLFAYSWLPGGQNTPSAVNLCPGTYSCVVTDAFGCQSSIVQAITEPTFSLTLGVLSNNVNCFGTSTGAVNASGLGGTPSYSYNLNGGAYQASSTFANQSAATYTIGVKDANGCLATQTIAVSQPPLITLTSTATAASCGLANGSATVTATGGAPGAYTYTWSAGSNTVSQGSLPAGSYTITVKDANNCTETLATTVPSVAGPTLSVASQSISCFGDNTGVITTTVSGGTGTFTYAWSNGTSNSSATNLAAGLYTVSATDQAGCVTSTFVTISQPTASLTVNIISTNPKCAIGQGQATGSGTATVNGGTPSYTYAWTSTGGTAATSNQLGAGNYNLTVTDANGCLAISTMSLVNPPAMSVSLSSTNIACGNVCNGIATATTTNGFGTISYLWIGGATPIATQTALGLCAGNYTLIATDQNNCTASSQTIITAPPVLTANISSTGSITCNGGNNGFAVVTPAGGTGAYSYTWAPSGGNTTNANNLTASVYSVTVQDANLCANTQTVTIIEPSAFTTTLTTTNVTCNGLCDGTANVAFSGGTGTTTFQWLPNLQSGNFVNNLCAGSYTVNITSNGSCTSSIPFAVTQPTLALTAATSATNSNCNQNNGQVCATVSGGTGTLSLQWSNGPTTLCNNNVFAGAYTFTVTDANNCTASANGLVNSVSGPTISLTSQSITCFGGNDGAVTTTITGGVPNYTVTWGTGQSTQNVSGLTAGPNNVTVIDGAGCSTSASFTITQPSQLVSAIASSTNVTCFGLSNGGAAVSVIGGTGSYSYVWSPSGQTTATLTNVPADSYTVNIQDTNGCLNSVSTSISQPTALSFASSSFTNTSCFGGNDGKIATLAQGGSPGYTYSWVPSGSGSVLAGLAAGGYTVTVTDTKTCTTSATFTISSPTALSASYVPTPATCNLANGSATLTVSGGTPTYNINWTTPGTPTGLIASNIPVGTGWTANITDLNGCPLTQTIGIASGPTPAITGFNIVPPTCFGLSNGTITINYSSTTAPYNVTWSNPLSQTTSSSALTQSVSGAASGVYTATLTDGTGCSVSASTVVTQPSSLTLITSPNASICFGNTTQISATAGGGAGAYTYTWTPNVGTGGGPHIVNPIGLNSYAVVASDVNGCLTSQKIITISVGSPLSAQGFAVTKCDGETAVLTPNITSPGNNGPYNFLWSTGQSNVGVFASSLNVTANVLSATNTYTVFIDDGCSIPSASASFTVNVNAGPIIDFTGIPLKGCAPLTVTLTGTSNGVNDVFTWNADKVQSGGFGSPYIVTFQDSGKYSITLNVTNPTTGCSSSITKVDYIEAYPLPIASFFTDPQSTVIIDPNFNFINTSQGATSYFWNFGDLNTSISSNTSIVKNPSHAYSYVGTYEVNLVATSIKGCRDIATIIVEVTPDFSLYIPNTFTPDGNGLNDVFQPLGVGINEDKYRMDIYDRWGENIFTSTEFKKGWDGFVNGGSKAAPQGVYTYKILVTDLEGNKRSKIGHVTVIRQYEK